LIADVEKNVHVDFPPELYPESLKNIAGRFHKDGSRIPISGKNLPDMRLTDQFVTPMGELLVSLFKKYKSDIELIYGVSGAGKTRAIFDMTINSELFVTYIECASPDLNFSKLIERINEIFTKFPIHEARKEAKHLIALEFVARVLYLVLLIRKTDEKLNPRDYLLAQINGGQRCIAEIKSYLIDIPRMNGNLIYKIYI